MQTLFENCMNNMRGSSPTSPYSPTIFPQYPSMSYIVSMVDPMHPNLSLGPRKLQFPMPSSMPSMLVRLLHLPLCNSCYEVNVLVGMIYDI